METTVSYEQLLQTYMVSIPEDYVIFLDKFQVVLSLSNFTQKIMNIENTECAVSYITTYATIFVRIM